MSSAKMQEQMAKMEEELKQLKAKNEQLERRVKVTAAVSRRRDKKYASVNVTGTTIKQQRFYAKLKPRHQLLPSLLALVNSLATPSKDIYEVCQLLEPTSVPFNYTSRCK